MAAQRKSKALRDAEKKIEELTAQLKQVEASKDIWYKQAQAEKEISEGIHEVLDDLGIRGWKDESNKYQRLPLAVRLFSWAMKLAGEKQNGKD